MRGFQVRYFVVNIDLAKLDYFMVHLFIYTYLEKYNMIFIKIPKKNEEAKSQRPRGSIELQVHDFTPVFCENNFKNKYIFQIKFFYIF